MAYRNGTYVAFHAEGTNLPGKSDMDYYNLMRAWTAKTDDDFAMFNSHEKAAAVRDTSKRATLESSLRFRLKNSKNFVLVIGATTRFDTDWVPFEIREAIDTYGLPIIAAYTGYNSILSPAQHRGLWPSDLAERIDDETARVIHIPFKKLPLQDAIGTFTHDNLPGWPLTHYTRETYVKWGLLP
ncbi:MAG TPA: TIR domain-containing protein [Chthoniobacterales bacterium]|jgi:hypothetical protein